MGKDGTLRDYFLEEWERTGVKPARLDGPKIPASCQALAQFFFALNSQRRLGGFGIPPLVIADITELARVQGFELSTWEFDTVLALDSVARAVMKTWKDSGS
jgi:hypothetical protein